MLVIITIIIIIIISISSHKWSESSFLITKTEVGRLKLFVKL